MLYPRVVRLNGKETLCDDTQCVGYKEHMTQNHRLLFLTGIIGARCITCGGGENDSHNLLMALDSPKLNPDHKPIRIMITSPGGDVDSTFLLIDTMKIIQSPVITIGKFCASAACLLLASGSKRYLYPHAKTMMHLATGQMGGDYKDFAIQNKQMISYQNKIIDLLLSAGVKKSREEILIDIDRDFWLEPKEVIEYGLCDEIITPEIWKELIKEGKDD